MKTRILTSLIFCLTSTLALARGGSTDGGSTGTVNKTQQAIHFDLFINDENFVDSVPGEQLQNLKTSSITTNEKPAREIPMRYGYARDQVHFKKVEERLRVWWKSSPMTVLALYKALRTLRFFVVENFEPNSSGISYQKPTLEHPYEKQLAEKTFALDFLGRTPPQRLFPVAIYMPIAKGAVIHNENFRKLGFVSQSAVLLKEAVRMLQDFRGANGLGPRLRQFSDATAQEVTYKILLRDPADESLDNPNLYSGDSMKTLAAVNPTPIFAAVEQVCATLQRLLPRGAAYKKYCSDEFTKIDLITFHSYSWTSLSVLSETGNDLLLTMEIHDSLDILSNRIVHAFGQASGKVGVMGIQGIDLIDIDSRPEKY